MTRLYRPSRLQEPRQLLQFLWVSGEVTGVQVQLLARKHGFVREFVVGKVDAVEDGLAEWTAVD